MLRVLGIAWLCFLLAANVAILWLLMHHAFRRIGYVGMPAVTIAAALSALKLGQSSVLVDLGAGDGRVLAAAHKEQPGLTAIGYETNPVLTIICRVLRHGIRMKQGDLFEANLGEATHVMVYLSPELNQRLGPKLQQELRSGARVVSVQFPVTSLKGREIFIPGAPAYANRLYVYEQ